MASVIVAWWDQQVELGLEVGRAFKTSQQSFVLPNNSTLTIDSTRKTLALHGAMFVGFVCCTTKFVFCTDTEFVRKIVGFVDMVLKLWTKSNLVGFDAVNSYYY